MTTVNMYYISFNSGAEYAISTSDGNSILTQSSGWSSFTSLDPTTGNPDGQGTVNFLVEQVCALTAFSIQVGG